MQINDTEELRLVKDLEETKSKVKKLESKLSEVPGGHEILRELREIKAEIAWMRRVEEMKARYEKARDDVIKKIWRLQDIKLLADYPRYPEFDELPGGAEYSPLRGTDGHWWLDNVDEM
ncbi:hypothetical protein OSB04_000815 [Centaurea solstitialis]|uniref:Uncharacterized protein n=1 Tax=Centaurea solstitialis TaxID=347529 RepID=A0AA38TRM3_9ASTR|nr:hypothetical protein OSB04_000815 [Centaurea solstitialis]